jgi:hypothetical protein
MPLNSVQMNFAPYDDGDPGVVSRMLSLFAGPRADGLLGFFRTVDRCGAEPEMGGRPRCGGLRTASGHRCDGGGGPTNARVPA